MQVRSGEEKLLPFHRRKLDPWQSCVPEVDWGRGAVLHVSWFAGGCEYCLSGLRLEANPAFPSDLMSSWNRRGR